jgi:type II secretory pathway pseudopilin PulG
MRTNKTREEDSFMEPATVMVVVLIIGVMALLVWLEINSRRNEAQQKRELELSHQVKRDRQASGKTEDNDRKVA